MVVERGGTTIGNPTPQEAAEKVGKQVPRGLQPGFSLAKAPIYPSRNSSALFFLWLGAGLGTGVTSAPTRVHLVGVEPMAREASHLYGLLAFLDPLFSRAPLVVEAHHGPVGCGRGQIIRRFTPTSKREYGITNQAVSKLFCPTPAKIRTFRLRWTHQHVRFRMMGPSQCVR